MKKLDDVLSGIKILGIDTSIFIYFMELHPLYNSLVCEIFHRIDTGTFAGVTSVVTLIEVLIRPFRQGNVYLQQEYRNLLLNSENFEIIPVDIGIADLAADLRSRYNLLIADAIQIASSLSVGCEAFLTNDTKLKRVAELPILVLSEITD